MNWLRKLLPTKKTAIRPLRKNVRLLVDRLEDRWAPAISITTTSLVPWTINAPNYDQAIATVGSTGPETFSVSAGALPTGLILNTSSGAITGTPTTAVVGDAFSIKVSDSLTDSATQPYTLTINPTIAFTTTTLPSWDVKKTGYSQTIAVTGGTGTDTFSVTGGTLPTGLVLNMNSGALTGMPYIPGAYNFQVTATDSVGATASAIYNVTIATALTFTTTSPLPAGTATVAYSQSIVATGGTGTVIFSVAPGALPTGLNLTTAGLISGTPTVPGTSSFTITVTDSLGTTFSDPMPPFSITINPALIFTTLSPLPTWTANFPYSETISVSTTANNFAVTTGALPAGLVLNKTTGAITGTPTTATPATPPKFTITATDTATDTSTGATGSQAYTLTINPALAIATTTLTGWDVNKAGYNQQLSATGGTGAVSFKLSGGSLPTGLTLSTTGALTGLPTAVANSSFQITATDSIGATASTTYALSIAAAPTISTTSPLATSTTNLAYSETLAATGGTGTLTFSYTGTLPAGLPLTAAGALSGTPTAGGTFNFTIIATDTLGASVSKAFTLKINPFTLRAALPNGMVNQGGYNANVSVAGSTGTGADTFAVTTGTLPAGLTLNTTTGLITGTPTSAGASTFTITGADSLGATVTKSYTVTISPPITFAPATLAPINLNQPYSQTITATGGTGAVSLAYAVAGKLPAGLTIAVSGHTLTITGKPTKDTSATITVTATDSVGAKSVMVFAFPTARRRGAN